MLIKVELLFLYIVLTVSTIVLILWKKIYVSTVAMAAVMSLGITTQGVLLNFFGTHFFYGTAGRIISIVNLALWSSFIFSLFLTYFNKTFKEFHYSNPINRFGIGTWVAGTSICGILLDKQFTEMDILVKILLYVNLGLWAFYICISIKTLANIVKKNLIKNVHGVLLLTTVSTQSIVLLANTVYKGVPLMVALFLTIIGVCFYLISAFLILKRYITLGPWSIRTDWHNTNCILHGALSITGLACLVSHLLPKHILLIIWYCAALVFIIVETIELCRLFSRIKYYGLKRAIFVYDVSQWSRVFTFAMFYTFTYLRGPNPYFTLHLRKLIIISGIWPILILVLFEIGLVFKYSMENYTKKVITRNPSNEINSSF